MFPTLQGRIWAASLEITSFILWKFKQYSKRIVHLFVKKKLFLEFLLNPGLKWTSFWTTRPRSLSRGPQARVFCEVREHACSPTECWKFKLLGLLEIMNLKLIFVKIWSVNCIGWSALYTPETRHLDVETVSSYD
mgnify:CR=1 FL=1